MSNDENQGTGGKKGTPPAGSGEGATNDPGREGPGKLGLRPLPRVGEGGLGSSILAGLVAGPPKPAGPETPAKPSPPSPGSFLGGVAKSEPRAPILGKLPSIRPPAVSVEVEASAAKSAEEPRAKIAELHEVMRPQRLPTASDERASKTMPLDVEALDLEIESDEEEVDLVESDSSAIFAEERGARGGPPPAPTRPEPSPAPGTLLGPHMARRSEPSPVAGMVSGPQAARRSEPVAASGTLVGPHTARRSEPAPAVSGAASPPAAPAPRSPAPASPPAVSRPDAPVSLRAPAPPDAKLNAPTPVAPESPVRMGSSTALAATMMAPPARARGARVGAGAVRAGDGVPAPLVGVAAVTAQGPFIAEATRMIADWEAELSAQPDLFRAARLHYEIARLVECPIGDLQRAAAAYQKALSLTPENIAALTGARRTLLALKSYAKALPLFDAEAKLTADPRRKALLIYAKGRVLEDSLSKDSDARQAYASAIELAPGNLSILRALERLDLKARNWRGLDSIYARSAAAMELDPRLRAALIIRRAHLLEVRLDDTRAAVELYETALQIDPHAPGAYSALKRLHHAQGRWRELIQVLAREADQVRDPEVRAMAYYRIARLHSERLGSRDQAIQALERAVVESPRSRLILEEMVTLYRSAGRFDAMVQALERMVDVIEAPQERIGLHNQIAALYDEELGDEDAAVRWYEASLALEPAYVPGLRALAKLYTRREAWAALITMNLREAEAVEDVVRKAAALHRVAEVYELREGDPLAAIEHHARALSLDPAHAGSFKALVRLYTAAERHHDLIELYERGIDGAANNAVRIAYLFRIGDIYMDALNEPMQAAHVFRRVLKIDPDHLGAIHAVQRATETAGRYKELVEALELEASKTKEPGRVVALLHRAGEVLDEELDDREGALARFRRILEIDRRYQPALASCGRLYFRMGRWEDLFSNYEQELAITPPGRASVALLYTMGRLAEEKLGREEVAIDCYRRAIKADPKSRPSLEALATILRDRERWTELVEVLETELRGLVEARARAATAYRIGRVYEERIGSPDRALTAYQRAIEAVPEFRPAIDGLARVRGLQEAWPGVVEDLARESATARDPSLAIAALLRAGEIWGEHLQQPERSIASYEAVLARDPSCLPALLALEPLYREKAAWPALAGVHGRESELFTDTSARIAALRDLARVQEIFGAGGAEQAQGTYGSILELDGGDLLALTATERLALAAGDDELLALVDVQLASSDDDRALIAAYHTRLAENLERSGAWRDALASYEAALSLDADCLAAMYGLSRVASSLGEARALVYAKGRLAAVERDGEVAAELLTDVARLRLERLDDPKGAQQALEEALERWPDHARAAAAIDEMLLGAAQAPLLVDVLSQAAESARTPERVAELWLRVAELYATELDNTSGGIAVLRRSLRDRPDHAGSLLLLAELCARNLHWTEAAETYRQVLRVNHEPEVQVAAHTRLAIILADHLSDLRGACEHLNAVLELRQDDRDTLLLLTDYYARGNDAQAAAEAARRLLRASTNKLDRVESIVHLSGVELKLGRPEQAREILLNAVVLEGPGGEAAREHQRLMTDGGSWQPYEDALHKHLRQAEIEGSSPAETFLELARVQGDLLGQPDRALATLEQGIASASDDVRLRVDLGARLRARGRPAEAIRAYQALILRHPQSAAGWRGLHDAYGEIGRSAEAGLALASLVVLGAASEVEGRTVARSVPRPPVGATGSMQPDLFRALVDRSDHGAIAERLLGIIGGSLARLYPLDLQRYGLTAKDKITSRTSHPIRGLADRLAEIFVVPEFELYLFRGPGTQVTLEFGAAPALLVPAPVLRLHESQQIFVLARAMADVSRGLHPLSKFKPQDLMLILAAAARTAAPSFGSTLADGAALDELNRRIAKSLARKDRKAFEDVTAAYVAAPPIDFNAWATENQFAATRAAALVIGDLVACVDVLRQEDPSLLYLEGEDLVQNGEPIADLIRYWCSEAAHELRRRLVAPRT
ncbi:MAG: tetratricopeptide repeat protein [Nannocystis sp.]|nr:tetratricopeptide repeat protein [Nannocystis sp.]